MRGVWIVVLCSTCLPSLADERPLDEAQKKIQGIWQVHDYGTTYATWKIEIDGRRFSAAHGKNWYKGQVTIGAGTPPGIDFLIEDCNCTTKGQTSQGIYRWEKGALVISAPQPGQARPSAFLPDRGDMMRLEKLP